jgi:hypothetical protein
MEEDVKKLSEEATAVFPEDSHRGLMCYIQGPFYRDPWSLSLYVSEDLVVDRCDTMEKQPKSLMNSSDEGSSENEAEGCLLM